VGARNYESIYLTFQAAQQFALRANTANGKQVRDYFIATATRLRTIRKQVANGRLGIVDNSTGASINVANNAIAPNNALSTQVLSDQQLLAIAMQNFAENDDRMRIVETFANARYRADVDKERVCQQAETDRKKIDAEVTQKKIDAKVTQKRLEVGTEEKRIGVEERLGMRKLDVEEEDRRKRLELDVEAHRQRMDIELAKHEHDLASKNKEHERKDKELELARIKVEAETMNVRVAERRENRLGKRRRGADRVVQHEEAEDEQPEVEEKGEQVVVEGLDGRAPVHHPDNVLRSNANYVKNTQLDNASILHLKNYAIHAVMFELLPEANGGITHVHIHGVRRVKFNIRMYGTHWKLVRDLFQYFVDDIASMKRSSCSLLNVACLSVGRQAPQLLALVNAKRDDEAVKMCVGRIGTLWSAVASA
jgi:hypothetical protein